MPTTKSSGKKLKGRKLSKSALIFNGNLDASFDTSRSSPAFGTAQEDGADCHLPESEHEKFYSLHILVDVAVSKLEELNAAKKARQEQ